MLADAIRPDMILRCKDVSEVLGIPAPAACVLLNSFNWSKEDLLEQYMNDSDKILKTAGIYGRCGHDIAPIESSTNEMRTCLICFEETNKMLSMPCGHAFCYDCWSDFCVNAVDDGPSCVVATCPHAGCTEVVTEEEMTEALGPASPVLAKFKNFQLRSFVESNPFTRWCPGRGCERVAYALSPAAMESDGSVAHCDACEMRFCLVCGEEPHAPAKCKSLARWNEKCRNESETANWILANTKSCPKCHSRIEKNQGCNHMSCQKCRFEFCWICMGDWHDHGANTGGYYKCNKFENATPGDGTDDMSDAGKAKRELDRYLHFYSRFHAHSEAQGFATKQLKATEQRMVQLQESSDDTRWSDVEFLKAANEQLVECRRVLKYTYVYGFYMDGQESMQRERFEHHQEMLERFTENLSELSEKPLEKMDRTDVVNQTRVVDRFMTNILKYVEDGMDDV